MAYYEPQARYNYCTNIVGEKLFTYGGEYGRAGTTSHPPTVVEVFNLSTQRWEQQQTSGKPHPGFIAASSATIGTNIYYFAGRNTTHTYFGNTYLNSLHCLNTLTLKWNEVVPSNPQESPIPKGGAAMLSYMKKRLVMYGGFGDLPVGTTIAGLYIPNPEWDNKSGWTSELHYFDIDDRTWTSPQTTGSPPPACQGCSLTRVDEHRAVLFGGEQLGRFIDNHVYILELQSWTWITVTAGQPWPVGRVYHSAVSLHDPDSHPSDPALMMMWGRRRGYVALSDAWNFSVNTRQWKQVILPDSLRGRGWHTTTAVYCDPTHKQLVTHGGYHEWPEDNQPDSVVPVTATTIVELEHTPSGDWVVGDIIRISQTGQRMNTKEKELYDMQLKFEELQEEKEKLEGQLQSTQDSIREIQQQLTPPEKSDQAIQTHGEPSYLQISAQASEKEKEFQVTLEQRAVETVIQPGAMSSPTPQIEMEQLNRKLAKEVQEYESALAHSQQTQQSLTLALAEKELQLSSRPAKMIELQATLERERGQREEGEKQMKTKEKELHDMQLKVDELQEDKEKLEGRLQSTQDSIKEIQQQLTSPEKSDQATLEQQAVETVIQPGAMSSPTPQIEIEMEQLNQKLAKEVQEYKSALAHSQQTQQSLTLALAEKELQLSARPAKMIELQSALEQQGIKLHRERQQREEGKKQLKTKEKEFHDMQLNVDELEEKKDKLEGQLQSTQESIKEKQEQLSPPEKRDQAIQTHGEPSHLQILAQTSEKEQEFQTTLEQRETQLDWERQRREEVEQQHKRKVDELQLQIDELREREKLAGQLQSSQTTGETALTTKEIQEQLSQPEKMDHKGPLPATQATGEATTTTKEIQEQLPPPEKRNQSVQTYTEPPFLQTLEATRATGEATTTTKEIQEQLTPPEKGDQSVQTYTEPPFLQTLEALQLRGVHVVGETTFTATRDSPTILNWEEYGFTLHIPKGALPPDIEQSHIHVKATIQGQFQLPDDHELVSAVFWIWCPYKLSKPATMEIEHCAAITTDKQCSALTFVRTHCSQEKLPYTFVPVQNGVFSPGSCYGSISLSRFSGNGIASKKCPKRKTSTKRGKRTKHDSLSLTPSTEDVLTDESIPPLPSSGQAKPTLAEQTSPTRIASSQPESLEASSSPIRSPAPKTVEIESETDTKRYCAQLYCAYKEGSWWMLYFVMIRDLKADMQAAMACFSGKATPEIEYFKLTLEEDQITLDIPAEGIARDGWKVIPCYNPIITKEDIHHFVSGSSMPALCELKAEWQHDQRRPHCLNHLTKIIGARPPRNYFLLTVTPVVETGRQSLSPHDVGASTDVHRPVFVFALDASNVCDILRECGFSFADWDLLAHRLCTDIDVKSLRQTQYNHERCLYEATCQWLHKDQEASWRKLADAVGRIGEYGHVVTKRILKKVGSN